MSFFVGDSVVVKSGVNDPDFKNDISGWQGRIEEIDDEDWILIRWDSKTRKQMPPDLINQCEDENLEWELMTLSVNDIQSAPEPEPDSRSITQKIIARIKSKIIGVPRLDDD